MITDKEFLAAELAMGVSPLNPAFNELCKLTVKAVEEEVELKTVLDYGCGVGAYAEQFRLAGHDVVGWEKFQAHKDFIKENLPDLKLVDKPITTDLMVFIEVAEHMTDKELKALFKKIKPTHILFSSTSEVTENDIEWGHINIKQQPEWIDFFEALGYEFVKDMPYPTSWTKLFKLS